jgi:hypothetical protein
MPVHGGCPENSRVERLRGFESYFLHGKVPELGLMGHPAKVLASNGPWVQIPLFPLIPA